MYHIIYPNKDSYIYEVRLNDEYNFGADNNLVLKKDFDGSIGLNGVSRLLLHFDLTETSKSIVSGDIVNPKYYLRLYEQKTSELSPTYELKAFPLSQSFEEGSGHTEQNPNSRDGVSWARRDEKFDTTKWSLVNNTNADTGSRSVIGGGVWLTGSGYEASQSFSYESPDINMNVTDIVSKWLGGTTNISNEGFIVKWSEPFENSVSTSGDINYFSREGHTVFTPQLEVRWDDHLPCTGSNTGSLKQLSIDGTKDNYLYMINLKNTYRETETPKFRVGGRLRYQTKSTSFSKGTTRTQFVPEKSGSYSITDVDTGKVIVPFGEHSYLSCDSTSNFFKQRLDGFITNRKYRIKLRLETDDKKKIIFDDDFEFRVVS